jgi:hypothetical protein
MLTLMLVTALGACSAPSDGRLVGFWEGNPGRSGFGSTLEFRSDGMAVTATTVMVDRSYRVEGNRLIETYEAGNTTESSFRLDKGELILSNPNNNNPESPRTRFGPAAGKGDSIVGVWRFRHYTGATAYERYTSDGRVLLRIPLSGYAGCFSVDGDRFSVTQPKNLSRQFTVTTSELKVHDNGRTYVYRRVPGMPWYPRDEK